MKRPLFLMGAVALCGTLSGFIFQNKTVLISAVIGILIILTAVLSMRFEIFRSAAVLLCVFLVFNIYIVSVLINDAERLNGLDQKSGDIEAVVVEEPDIKDGHIVYIAKTNLKNHLGIDKEYKIRLISTIGYNIDEFDVISARVEFRRLNEYIRNSCYADGVYLGGYIESVSDISEPENKPIYYYAIKIRRYIRNLFDDSFSPRISSILGAIATGDDSGLSFSDGVGIKKVGASHIIAVSGMHLGAVCYTLFKVLRKMKVNHKVSAVITFISVVTVAMVSAHTGSVMRSAIMFSVMLLGSAVFKKGDTLNSLGISVFLLLTINPFNCISLSFLLSVFATFGIIVLSPFITGYLTRFVNTESITGKVYYYFVSVASMSVSASIMTLPIITYVFGRISILSVVFNIAVSVFVYLILVCSVMGVLISAIPSFEFASQLFLFVAGISAKIFYECLDFMSNFSFSTVEISKKYVIILTSIIIVAGILLVCLKKLGKRRIAVWGLSVVMLTAVTLSAGIESYREFNITVIDTYNSLATVISKGKNTAAVISDYRGNTIESLKTFLNSKNINCIDSLVLLSDEDMAAASVLSREMEIKNIISSVGFETIESENTNVTVADEEVEKISLLDGFEAQYIKADEGYALRFELEGERILIAKEDFDIEAETVISGIGERNFSRRRHIVLGKAEEIDSYIKERFSAGEETYFFEDSGNIVLNKKSGQNIKILNE